MSGHLLWAAVTLALLPSGCARLVSVTAARMMTQAPNTVDPRIGLANLQPIDSPLNGSDRRFWVSVGPPPANLLVSVVEPRPRGACPTGTILLLHGAYGRSEDTLAAAETFVSHGYRAVLVDLRGHGQSSGDRITWGVREAADLSQVIDVVQQNRLLAGGLGVYGFSFGGATAIQLAGADSRVRAVVAVAPFSSLADAAGHVVRTRVPGGRSWADDVWVAQTVHEAASQAGFDPRAADVAAAIQRTRAPVLLIHGDADHLVPPYHSLRLRRAAPRHTHVVFVRDADHDDMVGDHAEKVVSMAVSWFHGCLPGPATTSSADHATACWPRATSHLHLPPFRCR